MQTIKKLTIPTTISALLIILITLVGLARLSFLESFPQLQWGIDLLLHWQWLYSALLILVSIYIMLRTRQVFAPIIVAFFPFVNAPAALKSSTQTPTLKVASANVYYQSQSISALRQWLDQEKPDIVTLLEFAPQHEAQVKQWADYPYQKLVADQSPFGLAILSHFPLDGNFIATEPNNTSYIRTTVQFNNQTIQIIAYHPVPPLSADYLKLRNESLMDIVSKANSTQLPTLIMGDFNATPWTPVFHELSKLNWHRAMNLTPTWPTWGRKIIGIPIDQVLGSYHWSVVNSKVGTNIGSDHFPIMAELALKP